MATQADGSVWEEECTAPGAVAGRQGFFPDGSRSFEEIDRLSIGVEGTASLLSSIATVDFYRGVPPGGYTRACLRLDPVSPLRPFCDFASKNGTSGTQLRVRRQDVAELQCFAGLRSCRNRRDAVHKCKHGNC
jgi:hypothetical protein